ncbi:MAG: hypothetical protein KGI49_00970, partial [Patescibacteria group bacterium]|nr:hypothetical protein [Patescibacteria group bacterium]
KQSKVTPPKTPRIPAKSASGKTGGKKDGINWWLVGLAILIAVVAIGSIAYLSLKGHGSFVAMLKHSASNITASSPAGSGAENQSATVPTINVCSNVVTDHSAIIVAPTIINNAQTSGLQAAPIQYGSPPPIQNPNPGCSYNDLMSMTNDVPDVSSETPQYHAQATPQPAPPPQQSLSGPVEQRDYCYAEPPLVWNHYVDYPAPVGFQWGWSWPSYGVGEFVGGYHGGRGMHYGEHRHDNYNHGSRHDGGHGHRR